jgi:NDP-sugar pyrophosphorylase family protein
MDAIIPAAGLATRMRGIPKFLLPCDDKYTTLIELHVQNMLKICDTVWIPTRPELVHLLDSINLPADRVAILPMNTENMTQTVKRVLNIAKADKYFLVMPDTFFYGETPYEFTEGNSDALVNLFCWEIRDEQKGKLGQVLANSEGRVEDIQDKNPLCQYPISWGALIFQSELVKFAHDDEPHIGYAVKNALNEGKKIMARKLNGKYFDCGTPKEYLSLLQEVL